MATLEQAQTAIWTLLAAQLTTVRYKPEHPTEMLSVYPAMVVYVGSGTWEMEFGANARKGLANLIIEIHVSRAQGLHRAIDELMPYLSSVPNAVFLALRQQTFTVNDFTFGLMSYEILSGEWGTDATMLARFTLEGVKTRNTVA
jgi:hypothetical protein